MKLAMAVLMCGSFLSATLLGAAVRAEDDAGELEVGSKAPTFTCTDDKGGTFKSTDVVGKKILVVYFYPAALTGGCTKQACGFRDDMKTLQGQGVEVVGVSGDKPEGLALFKKVHDLNFTLLADFDGAVGKKFGVPIGNGGTFTYKDEDGNSHELVRGVTESRWTFVVDLGGNVAMKNTKVNAAEDSKAIVTLVEELKGEK